MSTSSSGFTLTDYQGYASGSYMAFVAPWNKGNLVQSVDYSESITGNGSLFPNDLVITSDWPSVASSSVYGFNLVAFGDYAGTTVPTPIQSAQIKNIGRLIEKHQFSISGDTEGMDVIDDLFLTSAPGSKSPHVAEIEICLHTPGYGATFVHDSRQIGQVFLDGRMWTVAVAAVSGKPPDILFMPTDGQDYGSGVVHIGKMLQYLVQHGVLTGNEYFNGLGFGEETRQGDSTTTIGGFSVDYQPWRTAAAKANRPSAAKAEFMTQAASTAGSAASAGLGHALLAAFASPADSFGGSPTSGHAGPTAVAGNADETRPHQGYAGADHFRSTNW